MRVYSPSTNKGRTVSHDDVHHKTADQPRGDARAAAKALRKAAQQEGRQQARQAFTPARKTMP